VKRALLFGDGALEVDLPARTVELPAPAPLPAIVDVEGAVRAAIERPLGSAPLRELAEAARKADLAPGVPRALVAFDDGAVPAFPVAEPDFRAVAVPVVLETLAAAGIGPAETLLVCANALHRKWTRGEMARFLGPALPLLAPPQRLRCHDAEAPGAIAALGETPRGMEVRVARECAEAPLVVYVNVTATPMNGGWKSIVVGLSDFASIRHHHRPWPHAQGHSIMDPHRSAFQKLLGEMGRVVEAARAARGLAPIFTIESACTNEMPARVAHVSAGAIPAAHAATLEALERQQVVRLEAPFDCAILGLPAVDPYSVHSIQNPILAVNLGLSYAYGLFQGQPYVRPGGALILCSPLRRRFSAIHHPSYEEFYERVLGATRDPVEAWDLFVDDFAHRPEYVHKYRHAYGFHGAHPFFMWNGTLAPRAHLGRIIFAGVEDAAVAARLGFESFARVEDAIASVESDLGRGCSIFRPTLPPLTIYRVAA
jgi:nickel-dependent lactate racemase